MARPRNAAASRNPVNHDALVKLAKKGLGHSAAATELGVTVGQISSMQWSTALVSAGRFSTAPATSASVRKLKDVEGNRWELIAARTGESVTRVKDLYGDADEVAAASNRRRGNGNGSSSKTSGASKKKSAASGRKTGSAKSKTATAQAGPRRARTRAERARARSNNPS